ncbi:hypothetical protein HS7_06920 [Sulfolobales archaeon HS-7]|nr:hypothetical protein HS7_06920 [Sulfolobales archaeon HS-7]
MEIYKEKVSLRGPKAKVLYFPEVLGDINIFHSAFHQKSHAGKILLV